MSTSAFLCFFVLLQTLILSDCLEFPQTCKHYLLFKLIFNFKTIRAQISSLMIPPGTVTFLVLACFRVSVIFMSINSNCDSRNKGHKINVPILTNFSLLLSKKDF